MNREYYTTAGRGHSMKKFKEIEVDERENFELNEVEKWMKKYGLNDSSWVIWVSPDKRVAASYAFEADTDMSEVADCEIDSAVFRYTDDGTNIIEESDDGDEGYLLILMK